MDKDWVLFHLSEALKELVKTVKEIDDDPEYDEAEYSVAINHLYHHINTAWNARAGTYGGDEEFEKMRQFPTDIDMSC